MTVSCASHQAVVASLRDERTGLVQLAPEWCKPAILPAWAWGSVGRRRQDVGGTVHFYTADRRFEALLANPGQLLVAAPKTAVLPNCTVLDHDPAWLAQYQIGRSRECAATWGPAGIGLVVDICYPLSFLHLALAGVPHGWTSWATRVYPERQGWREALLDQVDAARARARPNTATILVWGGGERGREACQELGLVWMGASHVQG